MSRIHISIARSITLGVVALLALAIFLLQLRRDSIVNSLTDQNEAERWSYEGQRCGQVSIFFNESSQVKRDNIREFEYNLNKGMITAGLQGAGALPEDDNTVWASCFSAAGTLDVVRGNKKVTTLCYGVGGDFFQFHPMELLSGSYFDGNAVMKDYCVLDADLAWQLFGSNNIIGEQVMISGVPHFITGVIRRDNTKFAKAAGLTRPVIFTSFESLATYGTIDNTAISTASKSAATTASTSSGSDDDADEDEGSSGGGSDINENAGGITCYELVMPAPVKGYAGTFVQQTLSLDTDNVEVVNNSERFGNEALLSVIAGYGTRSMQVRSLTYPYWENAARGYEDICAMLLLMQIICALLIVLLVVIMIVRSYSRKKWTVESVTRGIGDKIYDVQAKIKGSREKWKYF